MNINSLALLSASLMTLSMMGCSEDVPTGSEPTFDPVLTVNVAPDPIPSQASPVAGFECRIAFEVTLTESVGLDLNINFFDLAMRELPSTDIVFERNIGADDIIDAVGSNLLPGASSFTTPIQPIDYNVPGGGCAGALTVRFQVEDRRERIFNDDRIFAVE